MFVKHPSFQEPSNPNIKIWRYLDFPKFASLIYSKSLYLALSDELGDPYEGSYPKRSKEQFERNILGQLKDGNAQSRFIESLDSLAKGRESFRKNFAINCWHANEYESAGMWKLYANYEMGIAIQTTISRLKESIKDDRDFYLSQIYYIDYETDSFPATNLFNAFSFKRKSFEHEKEIRVLYYSEIPMNMGFMVNVDIEMLIKNIFISPTSPKWFADLVKQLVSHMDLSIDVNHSRLNDNPLF